MRQLLKMLPSPLCSIALFALLAGCATLPNAPRTEIVTIDVPISLRSCLPSPTMRVPKLPAGVTQKDVANYIVALDAAHFDCKTKLAAVDKLLRQGAAASQPPVKK